MVQGEIAAAPLFQVRARPGLMSRILRIAGRNPLGVLGLVLVLALIFTAVFADQLAPYSPLAVNAEAQLVPPGPGHLLGADMFGRDVLSRVIHGARVSLSVGLGAVGLGMTLGTVFGLMSGYWGGTRLDTLIQRIMDAVMSMPSLILAIALLAALGNNIVNVIIAIGIVQVPRSSRVVRGAALSVREEVFIESAKSVGARDFRILLRHILPNVVAPITVLASVDLGQAILVEGSLSFLGYGTPPPFPSWGGMMGVEGRNFVEVAPWIAIFPGVALSLAVLGLNLAGDSLRDILDPRLRQ